MSRRPSEIGGLDDVSAADLLEQATMQVSGRELAKQPLSQRNAILGGAAILLLIFLVFGFGGDGGHGLPFGWRSKLVGEVPPEGPLQGVVYGEFFELAQATILPDADHIVLEDTLGRRVYLEVRCGRDEECPIGTAISIPRPVTTRIGRGADVPPKIRVEDVDGAPLLTTERGYVVVLKVGPREGNQATVRMYLCLQNEDQGFLGGSFQATIGG